MKVAIKLDLSLGDESYRVELSLPAAKPTKEAPFEFVVSQVDVDAEKKETADDLVRVALGDSEHILVAVKPPQKLIVQAGVSQYVKSMEVLVQQGNFDTAAHKFVEKADPQDPV